MKKSRIALWLTEVYSVRPIVLAAGIVVLLDIIYVNLIFRYPTLGDQNGQMAEIQGIVREKTYDEQGKVKSLSIGNTLCYVNKIGGDVTAGMGDYVNLHGEIYDFEPPMNLGEADMKKYYASKKIYYYCYADSVKVTEHHFSLRESFLKLRVKLAKCVMDNLQFEGGTVNTLLLGDKSNLPVDRKALYQKAGVAHFLVISGLHISAVGTFIYSLIKRTGMKRPIACMSSLLFLTLYGILVGFSVSVIRAIIMFLVRLCADMFKELYDMMNALAFSVICTLLINPLYLFDSAFIYSYVTVFAIALYLSYIHRIPYRRKGLFRFVREALRIPFVLLLFIIPVSLRLSYEYSLLSVIVNAILAPLAAPILLLGFLCLAFSITGWTVPAHFFDFLLHVLLIFLDRLCGISGKLSEFICVRRPSVLEIGIYYFFLGFYFLHIKKDGSTFTRIFLIVNLLYFLGSGAFYVPKISMLYVGQGECVVIKTGADTAVISDCGSTSKKQLAKYTVVPFLKASGIRRVQTIFLSHSDFDHLGAVCELISETGAEGIVLDSITLPKVPTEISDFREICDAAKAYGIRVRVIEKGAVMRYGAFSFRCLSPSMKDLLYDSNSDSMVILASAGSFDVLLTGDITKETEKKLIPRLRDYDIEILKVAHHGSKGATSEEFLECVQPKVGLISAGINNVYHHPSLEVTTLLSKKRIPFFTTKDCGEIDVFFNPFSPTKIFVKSFYN